MILGWLGGRLARAGAIVPFLKLKINFIYILAQRKRLSSSSFQRALASPIGPTMRSRSAEMEVVVPLRTRLLALALVARACAARAEEPDPRSEVIVVYGSASRSPGLFEPTPVETEVLSAREIQDLPAENAAAVLQLLPGIRTQPRAQGEEAAVSIEGMPPEYTAILVNGRRYTGEIGAVSDLRDVPLENVERIEILRGAQALRYGTEAAGGVVNVVTFDPPRDGLRARARTGAGSDESRLASGTGGWGSALLGASLSYDHDQIDGFDAPEDLGEGILVGGTSDSRRLSRDANGAFAWSPSASLALETRLGWRQEDDDLAFEDAPGTSSRDTRRWLASQELEWEAGPSTRAAGSFSYFRSDTESEVGRPFELGEDEFALDLAAERSLDAWPLTPFVTLGLDAPLNRLRLDEGPLPPGIENDSLVAQDVDESFRQLGLYAIVEAEIAWWLSLEAGARTQLHSAFSPQILPQAALLLSPLEELRFRLSYGRNGRTPSLRDLYQPPVPQLGGAYFLEGNPDLTPESSRSYRAGFEYDAGSWLSLSAVGFWNEIDDHIRSTFARTVQIGTQQVEVTLPAEVPPGLELICRATNDFFPECALLDDTVTQILEIPLTSNVFQKTNLDSVRTRGVETRLALRPHPLLELHLGYTYLDTQVEDPDLPDLTELPNEPRHSVDGWGTVEVPRISTRLSLAVQWRGRALLETSGTGLVGFTGADHSDPSVIVDARVVQPIGSRVELYADLFNLTDERVVDSYVVRGRSFFVGVRAHFD
jgi:outer membrane receptor for ferrienterochelin and colicins